MLDVHPPHEAAHSWRDIFIHLATITVGLVIALSLEGMVESVHHHHLVRETRENIRAELTENQKTLADDIKGLKDDELQIQRDMDTLRSMRADPKSHGKITIEFAWNSMSNSAWQTAHDTGALSYMPLDRVQAFADTYGQQELVNNAGRALFTYETKILVPLMIEKSSDPSTPAQIDDALHRCAETYVQLHFLEDVIRGLESNYTDALRDK